MAKTLYPVLQNIRYHGDASKDGKKGPLHRALITPDMEIAKTGLSFDHLTEAEIEMLQKKRVLGPAIGGAAPAVKTTDSKAEAGKS